MSSVLQISRLKHEQRRKCPGGRQKRGAGIQPPLLDFTFSRCFLKSQLPPCFWELSWLPSHFFFLLPPLISFFFFFFKLWYILSGILSAIATCFSSGGEWCAGRGRLCRAVGSSSSNGLCAAINYPARHERERWERGV